MTSPSFTVQRILAAAGLITAFVFMASIFSPNPSRANQPASAPAIAAPKVAVPTPTVETSTDAHAGLVSLGQIQTNAYLVTIYSTTVGLRYTVTQRSTGKEIATLMSAQDIAKYYPELPLAEIRFGTEGRDEDSGSKTAGPLMMADTPSTGR